MVKEGGNGRFRLPAPIQREELSEPGANGLTIQSAHSRVAPPHYAPSMP